MMNVTTSSTMLVRLLLVDVLQRTDDIQLSGKGKVGDWLQQQPSDVSEKGLTWSMLTTGPYMEMLNNVRLLISYQPLKLTLLHLDAFRRQSSAL